MEYGRRDILQINYELLKTILMSPVKFIFAYFRYPVNETLSAFIFAYRFSFLAIKLVGEKYSILTTFAFVAGAHTFIPVTR